MAEDERLHEIIRMLHQYSARAPLKFPTEAEIPKLGQKILDTACGPTSLWTKWSKDREELVSRAVDVWVPLDDLRDALNNLPGEHLTATDVEQRVYALRHEYSGYSRGPDEELKEESFAAYAAEKAKGTAISRLPHELPSGICGAPSPPNMERRSNISETAREWSKACSKSVCDEETLIPSHGSSQRRCSSGPAAS